MAAPKWFDKSYYLTSKLEVMREQVGYENLSMNGLKQMFKDCGYDPDSADSLYAHFNKYGHAENVSPDSYFDVDYYFQSKAADYYNVKYVEQVTDSQVQFIKAAFAKVGLSAWDHYLKYGMKEGIDPNANFNTSKYMDAKLAQMKVTDPSYTMDQLLDAFKAANLNPVQHYFSYGQSEGLTISPASHGGVSQALTTKIDDLAGTIGDPHFDEATGVITVDDTYDDYFSAELGTLQSEDKVDGLGGQDTLYARVNASQGAGKLEPTVTNVEKVLFRSEINNNYNYHTPTTSPATVSAYIDADRIIVADGTEMTIGSDNSRAALSIEDIRHNSSETVVRFADADPNVGFYVYFDPQHLKAKAAETSGTLQIELMDVKNAQNNANPLTEQPFDMFKFWYSGDDDGDLETFAFRAEDKALYTGSSATYATLLTAFEHALADYESAHPSMKGKFSVELGAQYDAVAKVGNQNYASDMGQYIVIKSVDGVIDADPVAHPGTGWGVSTGMVPALGGIVWGVHEAESTTCPLIQVDVELDNVARVQWNDAYPNCLPNDMLKGSEGGELEIGSMSFRSGVERMDVYVDEGSWLKGLFSTNNTLRMVTVQGRDINGDGVIGNVKALANNAEDQAGQLFIGTWNGKLDDIGSYKSDNLTWADPARLLDADTTGTTGLKDVAVFDATDYDGDINIGATITADSYDKYFKSVDGERYIDKMFAPLANEKYDGAFSYFTGNGNDTVNMDVNGGIAADVDFELNINTAKGDDLVAFNYKAMSANQAYNQKYLQNVAINTEDGNDTVWFYTQAPKYNANAQQGDGSVIINAGAGNDKVYANQIDLFTGGAEELNKGVLAGADKYNAVIVFNATDRTIAKTYFDGATLNNDIKSGLSTFNFVKADATTFKGMQKFWVDVKYQGFHAKAEFDDFAVTSGSDGKYYAKVDGHTYLTAEQINHAIIDAINNDTSAMHGHALSDVIAAKDGAGHSLIVESLLNGKVDGKDLSITFHMSDGAAKPVTLNTSQIFDSSATTVDKAYGNGDNKYGWDATNTLNYNGDPTDNLADNVNTQVVVEASAGNDLIALGHNTLKDVIDLTSGFGDDTVYDFEYKASATTAGTAAAAAVPGKPAPDMINVGHLLGKDQPAKVLADDSFATLTKDSATIYHWKYDGNTEKGGDGVLSDSEAKAVLQKITKFDSSTVKDSDSAQAVVLVETTDKAGDNVVLNAVLVTKNAGTAVGKGSDFTYKVEGSLTFDNNAAYDNDPATNADITSVNLVGVGTEDLQLVDTPVV
ncbi:MAG: hypothetical protein K6G15_05880 [Desulfovibrio sp.]|nr:hypothetical protein [Desulfovibrio sp.]